MAYEILTWIVEDSEKKDADYKGIMTKPFTKLEDVSEQLQSLRQKGLAKKDKRIDSFVRAYGTDKILKFIDDSDITPNNQRWMNELTSDIGKAKDEDDLGVIRERLTAERGNYEEESVAVIESSLGARLEEVKITGDREMIVRDFTTQIESAETQEDLDKLPSMGEIRRIYGEDVRKVISGLVAERGGEITTLSERAFNRTLGEIGSATTSDRLDVISGRLMDIPNLTTDNRKELARELNRRRDEI